MSRTPYQDYAEKYVESIKPVYSEATCRNLLRRYKAQAKAVDFLYSQKKIKSSSPKNMDVQDVVTFIGYRKNRKTLINDEKSISPSEYSHEIDALKKIFAYVENAAVEMAIKKYPALKPRGRRPRLPSFTDAMYEKICQRMDTIDPGNFKLVRAYALVGICLECGTRTKEVRFIKWTDLDKTDDRWVIHINHVKGEDSYGSPRMVFVSPMLRRILEKYELLWNIHYEDLNLQKPIMFPSTYSKDNYLAGNSLRLIKTTVEKDIGFKFPLRKCRRSFGQNLVNHGVDIEAVSVLMGHNSTKTTEGFYARLPQEDAMERSIKGIRSE